MVAVHLIEGPVGAGKSTLAGRMAGELGVPWLDLDDWMVTLFSPDRPAEGFMPWYAARKARCIEQIWTVTERLLAAGIGPVLELGLVQRADRAAFYDRVDRAGCDLVVHVLDVPRDVRLERVRHRNTEQGRTFKMAVSDEIFEIADAAWEAPDDIERETRHIHLVSG